MSTMNLQYKGFGKGIAIAVVAVVAAIVGHAAGSMFGLPPLLFEGAAGGAVLGAFVYAQYRKVSNYSPLVDAQSTDRLEFDEPIPAKITTPPYEDEPAKEEVFALETDPDGNIPFKVWVKDDSGKEHHPYYATGVEFDTEE